MTRPNHLKFNFSLFGPLAVIAVATAAPQGSNGLVPVPNTVLPVVSRSQPALPFSGPASPNKIEVAVSLKPMDPTGLQAFADAVSDPNSKMYRQYISPEEVGSRFGASAKDVFAVKDFLAKGGLTVTHVGKNNMTVAAIGTREQVEALFQTKIANFQVTDESGTVAYRSNTTPLMVPATMVDKIQSINGVETYSRPKHRTTWLTPPLTRTLYGLAPLYTAGWQGTGRKVGISNWDGFVLNNGNLLITQYNLPVPPGGPMSNVTVIPVGTGSQNSGAQGEGDLDFQMMLAVAPLANIIIYDGTGGNLTTVLSTEASDNKTDVISESYGWNIDANTAAACHNTHLAMTSQGITYMCASGDNGTALGPFEYPDYDPEVMMVGGTDATTNTSGVRTGEITWDGGGGGWCTGPGASASAFNSLPSWQVGSGVPTTINKRLVPDVSLHATDYAIYFNGNLIHIGGTSASSPTFAAGLTTLEQKLFAATNKARLGRLQNKIYSQNGRPDVWFDIKSGPSIGTLPNGTQANPSVDWDFCSGWGPVNFDKFYSTLVTSVPLTPFYAQSVSTVTGTYQSGTKLSLNDVDSNQYAVSTAPVNGVGQVAAFSASYSCPITNIATLQMTFAVNGSSGGSALVFLWNNRTGAYDQVSSISLTGTVQTKTIGFTPSQIALYAQSNGAITTLIRGVMPSRARSNAVPFTFTCDKAMFAAAPPPQ